MRVICANCQLTWNKSGKILACPSCKSNAYDAAPNRSASPPASQTETAPPSNHRLLTDDVPGRSNLNG
jgi:hypothetical protein